MDVKEELESVWKLLTRIPVSGDYVEVMYAIKQKLRAAYDALEKEDGHGG